MTLQNIQKIKVIVANTAAKKCEHVTVVKSLDSGEPLSVTSGFISVLMYF